MNKVLGTWQKVMTQATGELGVVIATSGPGATNLITPLANALMDSTPYVSHNWTGCIRRHWK